MGHPLVYLNYRWFCTLESIQNLEGEVTLFTGCLWPSDPSDL